MLLFFQTFNDNYNDNLKKTIIIEIKLILNQS